MKAFTATRTASTLDEIWLVEHPPVFTQGLAGKPEHVLTPGEIPVVPVDRGGQVTYHGPGQVVIYPLLDLKRAKLGVRAIVSALEQATIGLLADYGITAYAKPDAPGVYVNEAKIASLGLRVRRGCCYHGLSLNVAMDLTPFARINPCGYAGLAMTQLSAHGVDATPEQVADALLDKLLSHLGYTVVEWFYDLPTLNIQEAPDA